MLLTNGTKKIHPTVHLQHTSVHETSGQQTRFPNVCAWRHHSTVYIFSSAQPETFWFGQYFPPDGSQSFSIKTTVWRFRTAQVVEIEEVSRVLGTQTQDDKGCGSRNNLGMFRLSHSVLNAGVSVTTIPASSTILIGPSPANWYGSQISFPLLVDHFLLFVCRLPHFNPLLQYTTSVL